MKPVTRERVLELARKYEQYPDSGPTPTLRGEGIFQFAEALLAEAIGPEIASRIDEPVYDVRIDRSYTDPNVRGRSA